MKFASPWEHLGQVAARMAPARDMKSPKHLQLSQRMQLQIALAAGTVAATVPI
jgi:hypothetical protein